MYDRCEPELLFSEPMKWRNEVKRTILNHTLYIDVALVFNRKVRVVRYHVTVVDLCTTHNILPPIIGVMIDGVTLFIHCGSILK